MHIAYSALRKVGQSATVGITNKDKLNHRVKAYQATCNKYSKEIAAIQKYIPGWLPAYPVL